MAACLMLTGLSTNRISYSASAWIDDASECDHRVLSLSPRTACRSFEDGLEAIAKGLLGMPDEQTMTMPAAPESAGASKADQIRQMARDLIEAAAQARTVQNESIASSERLQERLVVGTSMLTAIDAQLGRVESAIVSLNDLERLLDGTHGQTMERLEGLNRRIDEVAARLDNLEEIVEQAEVNIAQLSLGPARGLMAPPPDTSKSDAARGRMRDELSRLSESMHEAASRLHAALSETFLEEPPSDGPDRGPDSDSGPESPECGSPSDAADEPAAESGGETTDGFNGASCCHEGCQCNDAASFAETSESPDQSRPDAVSEVKPLHLSTQAA